MAQSTHVASRRGETASAPILVVSNRKTRWPNVTRRTRECHYELDVLFGEDVPWYGFEKLERPTIDEQGRVEATWLTYRRGVKRE